MFLGGSTISSCYLCVSSVVKYVAIFRLSLESICVVLFSRELLIVFLVLVELAINLKDAPGSPDASRSALWRFSVEVFADAELA